MKRRSIVIALVIAATLAASPGAARATPPSSCSDAHLQGQKLLKQRRLLEARQQFTACAAQTCSANVRDDCSSFLEEVRRRLPTVVLEARVGKDIVSDARVTMDGEPLASKLDGKAIEVDPGEHTFVFVRPSGESVAVERIVIESKTGQEVTAAFAPANTVVNTPADTEASGPAMPADSTAMPRDRSWTTQQWLGAGVAGLGLAIGLTGVALAVGGASKYNAANSKCPDPECLPGGTLDREMADGSAQQSLGIALGIGGGAALVGGLVLFLTGSRSDSHSTPRSAMAARPTVTQLSLSKTGFVLGGTF